MGYQHPNARSKDSSTRVASGTLPAAAPHDGGLDVRAVLGAVAYAVVLVDEAGRIDLVNAPAEELLGWKDAEAHGQSASDVVTLRGDGRAGAVLDVAAVAPVDGRTSTLRGVSLVGRDGTVRVVDVSVAHPEGAHGLVITLREVVARDVGVREAAGEAAVQEQLVRADRLAALGTLAGGVAHEINNPLTYVLVNVEHVIRQLRARAAAGEGLGIEEIEAQVTPLSQALEGATRVRGIVRDLMTFSRGHVDKRAFIDVRRVLEASLIMTAHELRHRARVDRRLRDVPPVVANEARLGQVFLNLLVNAAHAIPEGEVATNVVTVETDVDAAGNVVVLVRDTGNGIAPEHLVHVFDPFFTTHDGESTGLGLSIAHGIVASFGGTLAVSSALGRGTEMRVTLPPAPRYEAGAGGRNIITPGPSPVRSRVLVVDEDAQVADAIAKSLADEHDVEVTTTAFDALARLSRGERYDVVLCDLMMPNMTGMDLYREILRVAPQIAPRVVFLSGGVFTPRARAFVESLPNRCLEKPPDLAKLREIVRRRGA